MTSNYKSTIGGAVSALGSTLLGIGIVPQLAGTPSKALLYVAIAGFIVQAIGQFLGHLFAADAAALKDLTQQVQVNQADIALTKNAVRTGHTEILEKPKT